MYTVNGREKRQSNMDNPEKLATQGTSDEEKQKKNTTPDVLDTTLSKQTQCMVSI